VFQVEDTGIGIATSEQSRLFQKFQQLDQSYRRNYEGAGLGLALAKEFVDLHRGWIEVSSVEGQGSVFTVELPHPAPTAEFSLPDLGDQPSSGSRVVLIDAQEDSATLICDMLTAAGYQVIWMVEASTAMDQILFLQPVVVIADLQLFGRDARRAVFDHRSAPFTLLCPNWSWSRLLGLPLPTSSSTSVNSSKKN
jgi:two-component system sensor histidine kinase/response regulator